MTRLACLVLIVSGLGCGARTSSDLDVGDEPTDTSLAVVSTERDATCDSPISITVRYTNASTERATITIVRGRLVAVDTPEVYLPLVLTTPSSGYLGPGDVRTLTHVTARVDARRACDLCGRMVVTRVTAVDARHEPHAADGDAFLFTCPG